ncbi:hypothetical protein [Streptomyces sp. NPDC002845]
MKPSSARVRPRVDISYEPEASAASHRERSVMCRISPGTAREGPGACSDAEELKDLKEPEEAMRQRYGASRAARPRK